jgi:hypothetical protein
MYRKQVFPLHMREIASLSSLLLLFKRFEKECPRRKVHIKSRKM